MLLYCYFFMARVLFTTKALYFNMLVKIVILIIFRNVSMSG